MITTEKEQIVDEVDREPSCPSCIELREEIESTKKEHTETIKIIKKKIISTDELIREYKRKLQDFDKLAKQHEDLSKNYNDCQRSAGTLQVQLEKSSQAVEPLQKKISMLEHEGRLADSNIKTLQEKLEKSEGMCANLQTVIKKKEEEECKWRLERQIQAQDMQRKEEILKKKEDSVEKLQNLLSKEKDSKKEQTKEMKALKRKISKLENQLSQVKVEQSRSRIRPKVRKEQTPEPPDIRSDYHSTTTKNAYERSQKNKGKQDRRSLSSPRKVVSKTSNSLIPEDMLLFLHPPISPLPRSPMRQAELKNQTPVNEQGEWLSDSDDAQISCSSDSSFGSFGDLLAYGINGDEGIDHKLAHNTEVKEKVLDDLVKKGDLFLELKGEGMHENECGKDVNDVEDITSQTQSGQKCIVKHSSQLTNKEIEERAGETEAMKTDFGSKTTPEDLDKDITCASVKAEAFRSEEVAFNEKSCPGSVEEKTKETEEIQICKSVIATLVTQVCHTFVARENEKKTMADMGRSSEDLPDININVLAKDKVSKEFTTDKYVKQDSSMLGPATNENHENKKRGGTLIKNGVETDETLNESKDCKVFSENSNPSENCGKAVETKNNPVDSIPKPELQIAEKNKFEQTVSNAEEKVSNHSVMPQLLLPCLEKVFGKEKVNASKLLESNTNDIDMKLSKEKMIENAQDAIGKDSFISVPEKEKGTEVGIDSIGIQLETLNSDNNLNSSCALPSSQIKESRKRKSLIDPIDEPVRITRSKLRTLSGNSKHSKEHLSRTDYSDSLTSKTSEKVRMDRFNEVVYSGDVNNINVLPATSQKGSSGELKGKIVLESFEKNITNNLIPGNEFAGVSSDSVICGDRSGFDNINVAPSERSDSGITQENELERVKSESSDSKFGMNKNKVSSCKIPEVSISFPNNDEKSVYSHEKVIVKPISPLSQPLSPLFSSSSSVCDSPAYTKRSSRPSIVVDLEMLNSLGPPVSPLPPSPPHDYIKPLEDGSGLDLKPKTSFLKLGDVEILDVSDNAKENVMQLKYKGLSVRPAYYTEIKYATKCLKRIDLRDVDPQVVTNRFCDKKCISSSGPLATAIIEFLRQDTFDLIPEIISQCRTWKEKYRFEMGIQFVEFWKPIMTVFERDLIEILIKTSEKTDHHLGLISELVGQLTQSIADACALIDDCSKIESHCRLLTALCHRQSEAKRVTILLYDIVRVLHHTPAIALRLALNITAVWPAVFRFKDFSTQVSNSDDDNSMSAELSYSPLRHALCITLKKWSADMSLGDERYLFEYLWPSNHLECKDELSRLASELVHVLKRGSFDSVETSSLNSVAFEAVKALELVACILGWEWSHNVLIGELLWEILQSWACAEDKKKIEVKQDTHLTEDKEGGLKEPTEKGVNEASIVAVIQLIGLLCKTAIEHGETPAVDVVNLLCGILGQDDSHPHVAHSIQVATAFSLLFVSPWQLVQVSSCLQQWLDGNSIPVPPSLRQGIECVRKKVTPTDDSK